jgi:3-dehydroquinate synthase
MQPIPSDRYTIYFNDSGYQALNKWLLQNRYSMLIILCDDNTSQHCLSRLLPRLETEVPIEIIEIEPGEEMKTIQTCQNLWEALMDLGADRKSLLLNLGGGVISDLGGFVASTFKRGIDFINIPTSLLGMVDAAIGGKNGVDLGGAKNQIGTITPPRMVLVDTQYLQTLDVLQMQSGMAEMFKHGLIANRNYWNEFLDLTDEDSARFDNLIRESVAIKNNIVLQDPTENGVRKALNFGHTIGHALESHFLGSEQSVLHGHAVVAGMIMEAFLSMRLGLLTKESYLEISEVLKNYYPHIKIAASDVISILSLLIHDKKNEYGVVSFTLLCDIGKVVIDQQVSDDMIKEAFAQYAGVDIF